MDWIHDFLLPAMMSYWYIIPIITLVIILIITLKKWSFPVKPPLVDDFPITAYHLPFSLERLTTGVDNYRYDVLLSETFCASAQKLIQQIIEEKAAAFRKDETKRYGRQTFERDQFRKHLHEVMLCAINRAKTEGDVQIDYLARAAVAKMLIREIKSTYDKLLNDIRNLIREGHLSQHSYYNNPARMKAELFELQIQRWSIIQATGKIIFNHLDHVDKKYLNTIRQSNFGSGEELPGDLFLNPFFYSGKTDGFFMMENYDILLGQRMEDPDNQAQLLDLIKECFAQILPEESQEKKRIEEWIKHTDNAGILFDYPASRARSISQKKQKKKEEAAALKRGAKKQHQMLTFFYRKLDRLGIVKRIAAVYEIYPIIPLYCPPMRPRFILQFMTDPAHRKVVKNCLSSMKEIANTPYSISPLKKCRKEINRLRTDEKKQYLIRFFKGFFKYQRDYENYEFMQNAMDMINLLEDEKQIKLSRVNHTLYEFLVPEELSTHEKPVINHTIIKADVRGSTDIVHVMKGQRLNPASYFSMNMFDPITELLPEYDAFKVFIEGDAIILGIYERKESPQGWYGVARACGLAQQMLSIIHRYNLKNKERGLPLLEIGVGITFSGYSPTLFFDGDSQVMISPAINIADRLSGCSKEVRKKIAPKDLFFNNHVFQTTSEKTIESTSDDIFLRYNVNGIELHHKAFQKLKKEIKLRPFECHIPSVQKENIKFYTGTFPTVSGRKQRLIIREGIIPQVDKEDLSIIAKSNKKFYEVCTNPKIHAYLKQTTDKKL